MNNRATIPITIVNSNTLGILTSSSAITKAAISSALGMVSINPALAVSAAATGQDLNFERQSRLLWKMPFSNWGVLWKNSFQQTIFRVSHEEKMIKDIRLISQLMRPNLKSISPLMMRITVAHLLKINPAGIL